MDLSGEEKRIQALFHEVKAEDADFTPPFVEMWSAVHARVGRVERTPGLLKGFVTFPRLLMAALLIGFLIAGVVIWPRFGQPGRLALDILPLQLPNDRENAFDRQAQPIPDAFGIHKTKLQKQIDRVTRVPRPTGRKEVAISSLQRVKEIKLSLWQSPTAGLLKFPGDELLRNSPALNQSEHEMRGFLSNLN